MYKELQNVYRRLLMIPAVGPVFKIPVLTCRLLLGRKAGHGLRPAVDGDTLDLTVAALDSLRDEHARQAEEIILLETTLFAAHDKNGELSKKFENDMASLESRLRDLIESAAEDKVSDLSKKFENDMASLGSCLRDLIEFVRAETMFELRARTIRGGSIAVPFGTAPVEKRVIDTEKVEAQHQVGAVRLNLGCGHIPLEGYINVDMRALPGVDAVAEATDLPFEPGSVAEIYSSHLLEHFPVEHFRRVVLPYWKQLLRKGGELRATVPDAEAMLQDYSHGEMSFDDLREVAYGLQEYEGDFHYNMFSRMALAHLLREVGFDQISFLFQGRKNGKCRDMEIRAVRS